MHKRVLGIREVVNIPRSIPSILHPENTPGKGLKGQNCNVTACQMPGATWYNRIMKAWYCPKCAKDINHWCDVDGNERFCSFDLEAEEISKNLA